MSTINWISYDSPVSKSWSSVAFGNGVFIAVSPQGPDNNIIKSTDGINWTAMNSPSTARWMSITYANGRFVAVSDGVGTMVSTNYGESWTANSSAPNKRWTSVTFGHNKFVAVALPLDNTNGLVMTSPNGVNWTSANASSVETWWSVKYGNGIFVAVGNDNSIMTSRDGLTWTARVSKFDGAWNSLIFGNGRFVAVSADGNSIYSSNGTTWNKGITTNNDLTFLNNTITYGAGLFVAVADATAISSVTNTVMINEYRANWSYSDSAALKRWTSVTYGNGIFVAVASTFGSEGDNTIMSGVISSDICMLAGTPVKTDTGIVSIDKINPDIHTIGSKKILAITKTTQDKNYLVCFEPNSLHMNCPSRRTILTPNHEVLYNGKLSKAIHFVGTNNLITKVKYNKERLYNVLMEEHNIIEVNNMRVETLHPDHELAHKYRKDL
jgi:hypothetical protein